MTLTRRAKTFIGLMTLAAFAVVANAILHGQTWHPYLALTLLTVALITSRMKVKIPGITGNMSVNLPFLLMSVVTLSATESILIACASTIVQTLPKQGVKLKPVQLLFNVSMMVFSCGLAGLLFHAPLPARVHWFSLQLLLAATTAVFFLGQTVPVSIIVALTDGGTLRRIWTSLAQLSFPYFVVSAGVTSMVNSVSHRGVWLAALTLLPVMYGIYRSYKQYFAKAMQAAPQPSAMAASAGGKV
jgi:hypothetical protein